MAANLIGRPLGGTAFETKLNVGIQRTIFLQSRKRGELSTMTQMNSLPLPQAPSHKTDPRLAANWLGDLLKLFPPTSGMSSELMKAMVAIFCQYPESLLREICSQTSGMATSFKFLPSLFEFKQYCAQRATEDYEHERRVRENASLIPAPPPDPFEGCYTGPIEDIRPGDILLRGAGRRVPISGCRVVASTTRQRPEPARARVASDHLRAVRAGGASPRRCGGVLRRVETVRRLLAGSSASGLWQLHGSTLHEQLTAELRAGWRRCSAPWSARSRVEGGGGGLVSRCRWCGEELQRGVAEEAAQWRTKGGRYFCAHSADRCTTTARAERGVFAACHCVCSALHPAAGYLRSGRTRAHLLIAGRRVRVRRARLRSAGPPRRSQWALSGAGPGSSRCCTVRGVNTRKRPARRRGCVSALAREEWRIARSWWAPPGGAAALAAYCRTVARLRVKPSWSRAPGRCSSGGRARRWAIPWRRPAGELRGAYVGARVRVHPVGAAPAAASGTAVPASGCCHRRHLRTSWPSQHPGWALTACQHRRCAHRRGHVDNCVPVTRSPRSRARERWCSGCSAAPEEQQRATRSLAGRCSALTSCRSRATRSRSCSPGAHRQRRASPVHAKKCAGTPNRGCTLSTAPAACSAPARAAAALRGAVGDQRSGRTRRWCVLCGCMFGLGVRGERWFSARGAASARTPRTAPLRGGGCTGTAGRAPPARRVCPARAGARPVGVEAPVSARELVQAVRRVHPRLGELLLSEVLGAA